MRVFISYCCTFDLSEVLGAVPEVNAYKWSKQIGKLQSSMKTTLKKKKLCVKSQCKADMQELKSRLSVEVKRQMKNGARTTSTAVRHWCMNIMQEMEAEMAGRVWVQNGKLPFEIGRKIDQKVHEAFP